MKLKNFLVGVGALLLCSALLLPVPVQAADQGRSTTITTKVPDTHHVLLDIGEHGSVIINGTAYRQENKSVEIERLKEQTYTIQPDKGWQVESVSYGQKDTLDTVRLTDSSFTAPAVNRDDNKLIVRFAEIPSGSSGNNTDDQTKPGQNGSTGVKTGDTANITLYGTVLTLSFFLVVGLLRRKQKNN